MANETKIVITAATSQAESALRSLEGTVGGITRSFFNLSGVAAGLTGALSITAFAGFIKQSIDAADRLNDLAQKTGTSVEALAGLKFAADQNGTSLEAVANASKKLSTVMADHPDVLKKFGVTAKDSTGALVELADIFAAMPDGAEKTALAVKLLGKSGEEMVPFLNQGSAALRAMVEEGKRLNPVTAEMAKQADQFNDDLAKLSAQFSGLGIAIAKDSLKPLTQIASAMADAAREGGLLSATMVGLAMTWNALFTDDLLTRQQKITNELEALRKALDAPNVSKYGKDAISRRMIELQQELDGMQPKAPHAPATPKTDRRGKDLYGALGGDGKKKKQQPFDPEGDFWDQVDAARSKNQAKANEQAMRDYAKAIEEAKRIVADIDPVAKATAEWERLRDIQAQVGQEMLSDEQIAKAYAKAVGDEAEKEAKRADEAWKRMSENIQRNVGDVLYNGMNGNFRDIGDAFKQMLMRMMADAAAANITGALFGQQRGGGAFGGLGGMLGDLFGGGGGSGGGLAAPGSANDVLASMMGNFSFEGGGYTGMGVRSGGIDGRGGFPAILHPNETVIDHTRGQSVGRSINITNAPVINIDSRTDQGEVYKLVQNAVAHGNAQLVDRLQRQGALA